VQPVKCIIFISGIQEFPNFSHCKGGHKQIVLSCSSILKQPEIMLNACNYFSHILAIFKHLRLLSDIPEDSRAASSSG
jgi:hypothetical protein